MAREFDSIDKMEQQHNDDEEEGEEETEVDADANDKDSEQTVDDRPASKSLLLAYQIMYYPTFDWYSFPDEAESTLQVDSPPRPAVDSLVTNALQARYTSLPLLSMLGRIWLMDLDSDSCWIWIQNQFVKQVTCNSK